MKNKLLIIACLVIVLSMALILPLSIVNADYSDIVNDPNSIVNFNQQINFSTASSSGSTGGVSFTHSNNNEFFVTGTTSSTQWLNTGITGFSVIALHKYYFYINSSSASIWLSIASNNVDIQNNPTSNIKSFDTSYSNCTVYIKCYDNTYSYESIEFYCVDLTLMFGADNDDLTLTECQELFVSDYYSFNTGTAVSMSGLNSYAEGVQSVYDTLTYNYVGEDSFNLLQPYAFYRGSTYYNGSPSKEQSHISVASVDGDGWSSGNGFALYYPFTSSLLAGDTITLNGMLGSATDLGSHQQATTYIIIRYGDNIYDVMSVNSIVLQDATTYNINSFSYTLPSAATGLVFYSIQPFRVKDFTIQVRSLSVNYLVDSAYKNGYDNATSFYQPGGEKYEQIWNAGYRYGLNEDTPYTFGNLMTSVVEAPVNAVLGMFNFDFLGYNFKNVITLIITVCIIIAIIRLFLGLGASE